MPRPTLPSHLKNTKTYEVLLTQTTEEDLLKHFQEASETYEARWRFYYDRLDMLVQQHFNHNVYRKHNWRKGFPKRMIRGGYEWIHNDDYEGYSWLWDIFHDLRRCDLEFKWNQQEWFVEFYGLVDKRLDMLSSCVEELKRYDERNFETAKKEWEESDAEWIASEEKRKAHASHKPREYYIELFKQDKDAERWYKGIIPDNEETCELCIKEKKDKEEWEQKQREEEEREQQERDEFEKARVKPQQQQVQTPTLNYHCEDCDYHTTSKFQYERHMSSRDHINLIKRKSWYCETCQIQCRNQIEYDHHITTKKHKKAIGEHTAIVYRCEACDYTAKLKHHYDNHCLSKSHTQKIQAN